MIAKNIPAVEFAAWDENKDVGLFVIPISLPDQNPLAAAVTQALANMVGETYPGPEINDEKQISGWGMMGVEFGFERASTAGNKLAYRVKILQQEHKAYLAGAYGKLKEGADGTALEEALERVEFPLENAGSTNMSQRYTERDKYRHGLAFNEIGLFYYKAGQFEKSADYFRTGFEFERKSGVFLANAANALASAGKRQEALDYLTGNADLLATNMTLRAVQAHLQSQLEQTDSAVTNFGSLFAGGYRNDDYFAEYVTLLNQMRRQDVALAAVEEYLKKNDSAAVRLLEARLYKQKKNFPKAIELLKALAAKYPYDAEISLSLADAYNQAGLFADGVEVCQKMIDANSDSTTVYYLKGCGEFGMKRYREAKASFEAALKKSPANADAKSYLDLVSGMLGEGSNSGGRSRLRQCRFRRIY